MWWQLFEYGVNFFQALLMTYYINKRCSLRPHRFLFDVLLLIGIGIIISLLDLTNSFILDDLVFLLPLCFGIYFRKNSIPDILFWCLVLVLVFSVDATIASNIVSTMTSANWDEMMAVSDVRFLYIVFANLLHTLMIISISNIGRKNLAVSSLATACFLFSLLAQTAAVECFFAIRVTSQNSSPNVTFGTIGIFTSMILTIILYEIMGTEADIRTRLEREAQTTQLINAHQDELRTIYSNMLSTQHDLRHRITIAEKMLVQNRSEASQEVIDLLKDTDILNEFITGNTGVDAVLAAKKAVMTDAGIRFAFYPCPLSELPLAERKFVVLLSNILDNAIEAVMRLPDSAGSREIVLTFARTWDIFSLICENDMNPDTVQQGDGFFVSSKSHPELHGYGIRSIQNTVQEAGGLVDFIPDQDRFAVKIILPMGE